MAGHGLIVNTVSQRDRAPPGDDVQSLRYFEESSKLEPFPKDHVTIKNEKRPMAPPSLTFEDKQFPSKQLTRQIIYDYLAPFSLEQLHKLQEACSFCQAKSTLISKGYKMF